MAVYTKLAKKTLEDFINLYDVGLLENFSPIEEGIENTNYLVNTSSGKFILTLYERRIEVGELPFFISLTDHLRAKGINCPVTLKDRQGRQIQTLEGKKACLISFMEGQGVTKIEDYQLAALGAKVAAMHLGVKDFLLTRCNDMSISKWTSIFAQIGGKADEFKPGLKNFIAEEIYYLAANWPFGLPSGVIHADIFPDNVFFIDKKISGIIDFYFACTDAFAYDLAITINAWGLERDERRKNIFLENYEVGRKLSESEKAAFPVLLRGAALRFLLTRLYDWFNTPEKAMVKKKDPREYLEKLEFLSAG